MKYTVSTYSQADFEGLKAVWEKLQIGKEMTYFQTWEWNKMLLKGVPADSKYSEVLFVVALADNKPQMIAPLFIVKRTYRLINKPQVYMLGNAGWSDYLNFIYTDFQPEAADDIFEYLKEHYAHLHCNFASLKSKSSLYQYLAKHKLTADNEGICVSLHLDATVTEWWQRLSKHARQNLRTAKNRLAKDNIETSVCFDDSDIDKQELIAMRQARSEMKSERDEWERISRATKVKRWIKSHFLQLPNQGGYLPILDDPSSKVMTIKTTDGCLMAYFHYGMDEVHRQIVVMSAGVSKQYERYSPGLLLMQAYIEQQIEQSQLQIIDFTRGNEPYKYQLGGTEQINHSVQFNLSDF